MRSFETFLKLHQNSNPLLLGNVWDVNSARIFEQKGYKAIGTSSQAVARSLGYEDGEKMPFDNLFHLAKRIVEVVKIPFSVDLEGGYCRSTTGIIENIERLHDIGVVGINLEDTIMTTSRQFLPVIDFTGIVSAIAENLSRRNLKIFLNLRTDGFLLRSPAALTDTIARIKNYENSGAHGIFVPCVVHANDIKEIVNATNLPVNVMCMPELPDFEELKTLGVKRISMGPFAYAYVNKKTEDLFGAVVKESNLSSLF